MFPTAADEREPARALLPSPKPLSPEERADRLAASLERSKLGAKAFTQAKSILDTKGLSQNVADAAALQALAALSLETKSSLAASRLSHMPRGTHRGARGSGRGGAGQPGKGNAVSSRHPASAPPSGRLAHSPRPAEPAEPPFDPRAAMAAALAAEGFGGDGMEEDCTVSGSAEGAA